MILWYISDKGCQLHVVKFVILFVNDSNEFANHKYKYEWKEGKLKVEEHQ